MPVGVARRIDAGDCPGERAAQLRRGLLGRVAQHPCLDGRQLGRIRQRRADVEDRAGMRPGEVALAEQPQCARVRGVQPLAAFEAGVDRSGARCAMLQRPPRRRLRARTSAALRRVPA